MSTAGRKLTKAEIENAFADGSAPFIRQILTTKEAADLLRITPKTLDTWKNAGRLEGAYRKRGNVMYWRDRLVDKVFNGPEWSNDKKSKEE